MYRRLSVKRKKEVGHRLEEREWPLCWHQQHRTDRKESSLYGGSSSSCWMWEDGKLEEGGGGCLSFDAHSSSSSPTPTQHFLDSIQPDLIFFFTPRLDLNIFLSVHHCAQRTIEFRFPPSSKLVQLFYIRFLFICMYVYLLGRLTNVQKKKKSCSIDKKELLDIV